MKRILAVPVTLVIAVAVLTVALSVAPNAVSASGSGGTISLGAVVGSGSAKDVTVVTGAATDPWSGYNIHIAAALGGGLVLSSITNVNGPLLTGSPFCVDSDPAAGQRILGCTAVGTTPPSIVAAGTLAVFTFNTVGNGCLVAKLITVPGNQTTDTYTVDRASTTPQTNVVDTTPQTILVGSGKNSDCPGGAAATTSVRVTGPAGCPSDSDCDAVPDQSDNCPHTSNPSQTDTDGDGVGDACVTTSTGPPSATLASDRMPYRLALAIGALAVLAGGGWVTWRRRRG